MSKKLGLIALTLTFSISHAQAGGVDRCKNVVKDFLGVWNVKTSDGLDESQKNISIYGRKSAESNGDVQKDNKVLKNPSKSGLYQQGVRVTQTADQTYIEHNGFIGRYDDGAVFVNAMTVVLDQNCKLKYVSYPQQWWDCKMNSKGAVIEPCQKELRKNRITITAQQCMEFYSKNSDKESLQNKVFDQVFKDEKQNFRSTPPGYHIDSPHESILANCRGKDSVLARHFPKLEKNTSWDNGSNSDGSPKAGKAY